MMAQCDLTSSDMAATSIDLANPTSIVFDHNDHRVSSDIIGAGTCNSVLQWHVLATHILVATHEESSTKGCYRLSVAALNLTVFHLANYLVLKNTYSNCDLRTVLPRTIPSSFTSTIP